jgi:hypothetical protein
MLERHTAILRQGRGTVGELEVVAPDGGRFHFPVDEPLSWPAVARCLRRHGYAVAGHWRELLDGHHEVAVLCSKVGQSTTT